VACCAGRLSGLPATPLGPAAMRLISLLNHYQHFPGFVYERARHCAPSQTIGKRRAITTVASD